MKQCPKCMDLFKDEATECPKCHCELEAGDEDYTAEVTGHSTAKSRIGTYFIMTAFDKAVCCVLAVEALLLAVGCITGAVIEKTILFLILLTVGFALLLAFKGYVYEFGNTADRRFIDEETSERQYRIKSGASSHLRESIFFNRRIRIVCVCWAVCMFFPSIFAALGKFK